MQVHLNSLSAEASDYFESCARIRNMSNVHFFEVLLNIIARDQLVPAIMDDEGNGAVHRQLGKHRHQVRRKIFE